MCQMEHISHPIFSSGTALACLVPDPSIDGQIYDLDHDVGKLLSAFKVVQSPNQRSSNWRLTPSRVANSIVPSHSSSNEVFVQTEANIAGR